MGDPLTKPLGPVERRHCEIVQTAFKVPFERGARLREIERYDEYRRREEERSMANLLHREGLVTRATAVDYNTCTTLHRSSMVVIKDKDHRDNAIAMWDAHKDAGRHEVIGMLMEEIGRYDRHEVPFGPTIAASLRVILQRVRSQAQVSFEDDRNVHSHA